MKLTRREFVKTTALTGAALAAFKLSLRNAMAFSQSDKLAKWIQPIRGLNTGISGLGALSDPNGIPVLSGTADPVFANTTLYRITAGEFTDQLHPALGPTHLWGYYQTTTNPTKKHLGGVILARRGSPNRLRFTNMLPAQHIIPVDTTIPGANLAQNRMAVHVHGGLVPWISDGGPFDWWSPAGTSYATGLSFLNGPGSVLDNIPGSPIVPGQADYFYPNDQSARLLWYHDHAFGITRLNAYAGIATGYLILDSINDAYVTAGKIPGLTQTIPLVFQDKIFVSERNTPIVDPGWYNVTPAKVHGAGSLWYAHTYDPARWRQVTGSKYLFPPDPSSIPEYFGDTMLANGLVFPLLTVEPKRYRFFLLNACNARFLNINTFVANENNPDGIDLNANTLFPSNPKGPDIIQIGNEAGFLVTETKYTSTIPANPATFSGNLLLAPAERADIIMDFTNFAGQDIILYSDAPGPFPSGDSRNDYFLGNPFNPVQPNPGTGPDTRQILRIRVLEMSDIPNFHPDPQPAGIILDPTKVDPPLLAIQTVPGAPLTPMVPVVRTRDLTLNEVFDQYGRLRQMLGTTAPAKLGNGFGREYLEPPTEVVQKGTVEIWRIFNTTGDTHPMHFHLVNVQVVSRQPFRVMAGRFLPFGTARGPEPNELGWKETVKHNPGEVTTLIMKFDLANVPFVVPESPRTTGHEYVWHCHILEHEEHDMMRPLIVKT